MLKNRHTCVVLVLTRLKHEICFVNYRLVRASETPSQNNDDDDDVDTDT